MTGKLIFLSKSQIPGPLNNDIESEELEKKKQQKKLKRERKKEKRQEFEMKKQEEAMKQDFLSLSDREKVTFEILKRSTYFYRCEDAYKYLSAEGCSS